MKKEHALYLILLFFASSVLSAQKYSSLFKAGATIGVNLSQIDGDEQFGYNRKGLNFGLRGAVILRKDIDISTELLYSERGTKPDNDEISKQKRVIDVSLSYAEVPILFNYFYDKSDMGHYRWNIYVGVSYGRLLKSDTKIRKSVSLTDTLQQNLVNAIGYNTADLSLIIGIKRYFTNRVGVSLRHTFSMNYLYKNPKPIIITRGQQPNKDYATFRSFFLSFNLFYDFITPKIKKSRTVKKAQ
jgi:Outer membrane protein beta-barrel domain